MKKAIITAVILAGISGGAFAQQNTVLFGAGAMFNIPMALGVEIYADYEREIIPQFAVGATVSGQYFPFAFIAILATEGEIDNLVGYTIDAQARWYPFAGVFHIDAGVGFDYFLTSIPSFVVTADIGWNIRFGSSPIRMSIEVLRTEFFVPLGDNPIKYQPDPDNNPDKWVGLEPFNLMGMRIGFGFMF